MHASSLVYLCQQICGTLHDGKVHLIRNPTHLHTHPIPTPYQCFHSCRRAHVWGCWHSWSRGGSLGSWELPHSWESGTGQVLELDAPFEKTASLPETSQREFRSYCNHIERWLFIHYFSSLQTVLVTPIDVNRATYRPFHANMRWVWVYMYMYFTYPVCLA